MVFLSSPKSWGFSLIEVMIALLILGCVVFGVVTLALHTSQQVQEASSRGQAQILARDLIERINANPLAWPAGFQSLFSATAACSLAAPCLDPLEMAAREMADIRALATSSLPQGQISAHARCSNDAPTPCVVVAWQGVAATPSACLASQDDAAHADPRCFVLHFWPVQ